MTTISNSSTELSATFDIDHYHYRPNDAVRWTSVTGRAQRCDECAALQHETKGEYKPRRAARRRSIGSITLILCHLHAEAWKTRDDRMRG